MLLKKTFFLLLLIVLFSSTVLGVGIGEYNAKRIIPFQSGYTEEIRFQLFDSPNIAVSLEGNLVEHAILIDPNPNGGPRSVTVKLTLPEYLTPGSHMLYLVATEATTSNQPMGGIASVRAGIQVFALYPSKHPMLRSVNTPDSNIDEKSTLSISIVNYGEDAIGDAHGTIKIYDRENNLVAILQTDSKSIAPFQDIGLNAVLDGAVYSLTPGIYTANATFLYDNVVYPDSAQSSFRVGQMNVDIVDSTKEVYVNSTNKYMLTIESDWAGSITDVYARIATPNGKTLKTPNVDMISPGGTRKAAAQIETYWETEGLVVGSYDLNVTLYYKGLTSDKVVKVNVIEGTAPEIVKPVKEGNSTILYIIIVSVILIVFIVLYFLIFRKNGGSTNTIKNSGDDELRPPSL